MSKVETVEVKTATNKKMERGRDRENMFIGSSRDWVVVVTGAVVRGWRGTCTGGAPTVHQVVTHTRWRHVQCFV